MYQKFQIVAVTLIAAVFALSLLARRLPHVGWLQIFRDAFPPQTEEQRRLARKRGNFYTGVEFILMGIILPLGYGALKGMFFNEFTTLEIVIVTAASILCFGLGIAAIVSSRR